jgi:magnesium transporter
MDSDSVSPTPSVPNQETSAPIVMDDDVVEVLHDHRDQPDSLPIRPPRTSFSDRRLVETPLPETASDVSLNARIDVASASAAQRADRLRSMSFGSNFRRTRSYSRSSFAISEGSDDEPGVGILLNGSRPDGQASPIVERRRSRRMTKNSTAHSSSEDEDNGSRISFGEQNEEDVCFPMNKTTGRTGIDFSELDGFSEVPDGRQACRPHAIGFQCHHRPLVPHTIATEKRGSPSGSSDNQLESDTTRINFPFNEKHGSEYPLDYARTTKRRCSSVTVDRFSFFAADSEETIHATDIPSLVDEGQSFKDLFDESNGTWWLDCLNPSDAEMRVISKAFGIHPLTAEDIRTEESREKVELFRNYYFVCFHTFESDRESEEFLEPVNVYIIVFRDGILSFHFSPVHHSANVRRRIRQLRDYVSVSADWICYALIDDITDSFAPIIHEIEVETDVIEDSVFVAREEDFSHMLRRIGEARKKVMTVLRLLSGKADVIKMFAKRCNEQWENAPKAEIGLYLGDIQDHILTMHQNLTAYEKIFSRSHANYLAQIQVESVNSNHRVTQVLSKVTLVGTVLVPMNLITGLFGMNVHVPGGGDQGEQTLAWFFTIVGCIIVLVVILCFLAQRWMGSHENRNGGVRQNIRSSAASILSYRTRRSSSRIA